MQQQAFDTIFTNLALRKGYHLVGGLALLLVFYALKPSAIYIACVAYLLGFLILSRRVSFAVLGALILWALTGSRFAVLGAVVVFTLGDGLAAPIGSTFGTSRLPWNRDKTFQGSVAFVAGSMVGLAAFLSTATSLRGWDQLPIIIVAPIVGAAIESLPISAIRDRKPDDNLLVILGVGVLLFALQVLFVIPST